VVAAPTTAHRLPIRNRWTIRRATPRSIGPWSRLHPLQRTKRRPRLRRVI